MAINKEGNGYTFGFAIALVVVVGIALSTISLSLKPIQNKNAQAKKMIAILGAIKVDATRANAEELFKKHIKKQYVFDAAGNQAEGNAFDIDVKKQFRDKTISADKMKYPLYECENNGKKHYVIPMVGKGLWGPIWGFIAVNDDKITIFGAKFDHQGETPGLGAEIKNYERFQKQFEGKKIDQTMLVAKGGADQSSPYEVDGITGGTITSKGVEEMYNRSITIYNQGLKSL